MRQYLVRGHYSTLSEHPASGRHPRISFLPGAALGMSETFGARLRRVREEKGFTVPDLAAAVGVSPGAIRQLESGQVKNPAFSLGLRLADRLNVDPHYLAVGEGFSVTERLDNLELRVMKLERDALPNRSARR
jgi:transcriptional regulator with XRE-family HTH domain